MKKLVYLFLMMASVLSANQQQDIEAIYQLFDACDQALMQGDKETLMNSATEDYIRLLPGREILYGKDSFLETLNAYFNRVSVQDSRAEIDEVRIADGWAFVLARWSGTLISKQDGQVNQVTGKGMYILERQFDGTYKISRTSPSYDK